MARFFYVPVLSKNGHLFFGFTDVSQQPKLLSLKEKFEHGCKSHLIFEVMAIKSIIP
jgi:hypothetical protein